MGCGGSKVPVYPVHYLNTVRVNNPVAPNVSAETVQRVLALRPERQAAQMELLPDKINIRDTASKEMLLSIQLIHVANIGIEGTSKNILTVISGDPVGKLFTCVVLGLIRSQAKIFQQIRTNMSKAIPEPGTPEFEQLQARAKEKTGAKTPENALQAANRPQQQEVVIDLHPKQQQQPVQLQQQQQLQTPSLSREVSGSSLGDPTGPRRKTSMVASPDFQKQLFDAFYLGKTTVNFESGSAIADASKRMREEKIRPQNVEVSVDAEEISVKVKGKGDVLVSLLSHEVTFLGKNPENDYEMGLISKDQYEIKLCYILRAKDEGSARKILEIIGSAQQEAHNFARKASLRDHEGRVNEHLRNFARKKSMAVPNNFDATKEPEANPGTQTITPQPSRSQSNSSLQIDEKNPDSSQVLGTFISRYLGSVIVKEAKGMRAVEDAIQVLGGQQEQRSRTTGFKNVPSTILINGEGVRIVDQQSGKVVLITRLGTITFTTQVVDKKALKLLGTNPTEIGFAYIAKDEKLKRQHCELFAVSKRDAEGACAAVMKGFEVALLIKKLRKGNPFAAYSSTREGVSGPLWALQIHRSDLRAVRVIGMGQFGEVYLAKQIVPPGKGQDGGNYWDRAVKVLKGSASVADKGDFLQEAEIMLNLKHANLVQLIGVAVQQRPWLTVIEFMRYGDLLAFTTACKQKGMKLRYMEQLKCAVQISAGMQYLEKWNMIHMDLAARNVLLHDNNICKIADFGLTRKVNPQKGYYRLMMTLKLPIKWMALESLVDKIFSIKTDVWGFGVAVWETLSYGAIPYGDMKNIDVEENLKKGVRLNQPEDCPDAFYQLLLTCFHADPKQRPSFEKLESEIMALMNKAAPNQPAMRDIGRTLRSWGVSGPDNTPGNSEDEAGDDTADDDDDDDDDPFASSARNTRKKKAAMPIKNAGKRKRENNDEEEDDDDIVITSVTKTPKKRANQRVSSKRHSPEPDFDAMMSDNDGASHLEPPQSPPKSNEKTPARVFKPTSRALPVSITDGMDWTSTQNPVTQRTNAALDNEDDGGIPEAKPVEEVVSLITRPFVPIQPAAPTKKQTGVTNFKKFKKAYYTGMEQGVRSFPKMVEAGATHDRDTEAWFEEQNKRMAEIEKADEEGDHLFSTDAQPAKGRQGKSRQRALSSLISSRQKKKK
eukprot:m.209172 g.209172  ORF g.209172 m.209172 type:complete len:1167 (-) comp15815_c0_seq8:1075-4575(-)